MDHARAFDELYGAKFPKTVAKITDDVDALLAFYDFCAMSAVLYPSCSGERWEVSLDPMAYLAPKSRMGTVPCQKLAVMPRRMG